ncbi:hypothetical protein GGR50DRAFT_23124 [Xylaria sp. CBS 124048]|nr:hypothetical protein GGR50DRAFT_23124 [Xylaria sp. CBS 124048]
MNRRRTHRWTRKREGPTDTSGEQTNNIRADVAMTVRWEQFLCGKIKDSKMRELVTKILGTNARPGSKAYEREYQFVLNLCRRQRSTTLARAAKFVREMVQGDGDSRGAWANWCDPRVKYTDDVLREKIRSAWSWPRFYAIWHWFYRCADGEASTKLARYYCQQLWESIIFETIHYLRVMELSPGKVKEAQKRRNAVYVALPSHEHFAKVRRELFFERNISPEKKEKLDIAATLSHVVIPPPPSDDEELNDGDEEDYEDEDEEYEDD